MDELFELFTSSNRNESFEDQAPQSAFQRYTDQPIDGLQLASRRNANKKMIGFLKKISWAEKERSLKHMMMERVRRRKQKEIYKELHQLLPLGTKNDKNSILEMAVKVIEDLQQNKEELSRKNGEMEKILSEKAEIKLKVGHPASGVDSMLEVLRCFKNTGCTATAIHSHFSLDQLSAAVEFETTMRATDVEKAVQRTLFEAEMRLRCG